MSKKSIEKRLAKKTLEIHTKRRLAGADDSEKSVLISSVMAMQSLSRMAVSEPAAKKAAEYLLANRQLMPPLTFTLEKVLHSAHRMSDDQLNHVVDGIVSPKAQD